MATIKKACKGVSYPKSSSVSRRLKTGGSFPDLNKDGKITKKDVLIGRGVLPKTAKKGMKVKKAQDGTMQSPQKVAAEANRQKSIEKRKAFIGPLTESGAIRGSSEKEYQERKAEGDTSVVSARKYYGNDRYKKGGSVKKSAPKKMMMKTGGKMKKCAYGCK